MNNTVIGVLLGVFTISVIALIAFQKELPPRIDFHEIISDSTSTSTDGVVEEM